MVSAITSQLLYMHTEQEEEWSVLSQVNYCTCILNRRTNGQCYHKSTIVHAY